MKCDSSCHVVYRQNRGVKWGIPVTPASIRIRGFSVKKKNNENSIKPVIKWHAPHAVSVWRGEVKLKMEGWGSRRGSDVRSNQRVWTATGHLHFNHRKVRLACSIMFSRLWLNTHSVAKVIYGAGRMHWPLSRFTHLHVLWQHMRVTLLWFTDMWWAQSNIKGVKLSPQFCEDEDELTLHRMPSMCRSLGKCSMSTPKTMHWSYAESRHKYNVLMCFRVCHIIPLAFSHMCQVNTTKK